MIQRSCCLSSRPGGSPVTEAARRPKPTLGADGHSPCTGHLHSLLSVSMPQRGENCSPHFLGEQTETQRGSRVPAVTQHIRDSAGTRPALWIVEFVFSPGCLRGLPGAPKSPLLWSPQDLLASAFTRLHLPGLRNNSTLIWRQRTQPFAHRNKRGRGQ